MIAVCKFVENYFPSLTLSFLWMFLLLTVYHLNILLCIVTKTNAHRVALHTSKESKTKMHLIARVIQILYNEKCVCD